MPDFDVDLPDGRAVTVTAADANSAALAAHSWSTQGQNPQQQAAHADAVKAEAGSPNWLRSFDNGALANFLPEADATVAAAQTGVHNLFDKVTGGPGSGYGMSDAYQAVKDVAHSQQDRYAQDHPIANAAANIGGAVLSPINKVGGGYIAKSTDLAQAVRRGAAVGGAVGALYGAGAGGPGHRVRGATSGLVAGGVVGGAAPLVVAGVTAAARGASKTAQALGQGVKNTLAPDPEAALTSADTEGALAHVNSLLDGRNLDVSALDAADPFGKGITTAEAMGRPGVATLGALGRRSGTTGDGLYDALSSRAQQAPQRILGDYASATGLQPEEAAGNMEALTSRLRGEAAPAFDAALSSPNPVWNPNLADLAERPAIKKAIGTAAASLQNAGKDPMAMGFRLDPDTGWSLAGGGMDANGGLTEGGASITDLQPQPTAETWDRVRKALGYQVERHPITNKILPDSVSPGNYDLNTATRDLTGELRTSIPGYGKALDQSSDYLKLQSAFDRAHDSILNPNTSARMFGQTFDKLSAPEQQAWKAGVGAKLSDQLQAGRLKPSQLLLPHVQGKLSAALGPDTAQAFTERLQAESALARTGGRMIPESGSGSMEWLHAAAEQDQKPSVLGLVASLMKHPGTTLQNLANQGKTVGTSVQLRNELGRLLTQSPEATAAELRAVVPPTAPPVLPQMLPSQVYSPAGAIVPQLQRRK